ncbi:MULTISPECIES: hypothetical protein [unclassified Acinetobacter]|uniref:hypothetical protein n=1 Tax=unclassified Acinetobacter TaxID=196816 RepID=UPI0015D2455C|nr:MULTISPECIES: hypothetical protein [unclassified Acinetobacter]
MIDPRIPLMGQQQADPFESAARGIQFGQGLRQLLSGRQAGKMAALAPEERQAFANNSMFSRELNAQLKADTAAQEKAMYDRLKTEAEISKIGSEAYKNNQQGGGYALDNSGKKLGAIQGAFQQASLTGDKAQVLLGLNALVRTGMMSPEDYQSQAAIVGAMTPDELKQYAGGINFANAKDPAALQYQSADNAADNAQSDKNSQRTYDASIYSTDTAASTADKNRAQQQSQFDANLYVQQNKPLDYFTAADGTRYAVYANGQGIPVSGPSGEPVKAQQAGAMNSTIQGAILDTDDKISSTKNAITNLKDALKYSEKAYDGVGATQRAIVRGLIGEDERATATTMLDNVVTGNALEMLKATFGGSPTEGERAILLQLQGSANLPRAQREAVYSRAIQMAEARLASNQQKAADLRSGTYFSQQQQGVPYANAGQQQSSSTFNLFD